MPGEDETLTPLVETNICLRFSIMGSGLEYEETVQTTTDKFGMVNVKIGANTQTGGSATSIGDVDWDSGEKSMRVELNAIGNCSSFVQISYQTFSYVPFAYYAQNDSASAAIDDIVEAIVALQADVDGNESDGDDPDSAATAAIAALQADVDGNESDSDLSDTVMQADVDQNEADADAAIAALQADVDGNCNGCSSSNICIIAV